MSSALRDVQRGPTPHIPDLVVKMGGLSAAAGKSPAALEKLCREAPLDRWDTGQGSAPRGAGASRLPGSTRPCGSSEPKALPKARSPPRWQIGACPRPLLRLRLPHGKTRPRVRNCRSFCRAMHGKGRKVFCSAGCAWDLGARVPRKLVLLLGSISVPIPSQHDRAGECGRWDSERIYGQEALGSQSSAGPAWGMPCRPQPPKHTAVRARGGESAHRINLNTGEKLLTYG